MAGAIFHSGEVLLEEVFSHQNPSEKAPLFPVQLMVHQYRTVSKDLWSTWVDRPDLIMALTLKLCLTFVDQLEEEIQPLLDGENEGIRGDKFGENWGDSEENLGLNWGFSVREEWVQGLCLSLGEHLRGEIIPRILGENWEEKGGNHEEQVGNPQIISQNFC